MSRRPGLSVRLKLTISYAGFLMLAGVLMIAVVWLFLLRYVPDEIVLAGGEGNRPGRFIPNRMDLWRAFAPRIAQAMAGLLVLGLLGGWFLAGRMLSPLNRITRATRRAAEGSLSHRIELDGPQDEFRELADSFDDMLARLEAHDAEQQRFAANASHELRTPLAVTQTLLDVARNDPDRDIEALIERLQSVNARAIELTEALLTLSRAERRSFTREPVDLSLLVEEATESLLPLAEKRDVTIQTSAAPAQVAGSPALLLQMIMNLLHNAIVHNRPTGGRVRLSTGSVADAVLITVENTGEPLPADLLPTLTEPFQRGTSRIRTDQAGAGLGLAIVKRIVEAHDGRLDLTPGPEGGLAVTVRLPRTAQLES